MLGDNLRQNMNDKPITVYGFDNEPEFQSEVERWNYWETKASEIFGTMPSVEKAEWIAEKMRPH
tara:strand:- start:348 stop:539 length:192 start_codon:yes stop_codon:yes gene_type:complete